MEQIIGYTALSLNLISMSMKNTFYLRAGSLLANAIYVIYGFMIDAPPIFIGASVAMLLHSYRIFKAIEEKRELKNS